MSDTATQTGSQAAEARLDLHLDAEEVKGELATIPGGAADAPPDGDPEMERKAQDLVDKLIGFAAGDHDGQAEAKSAVDEMGRALQQEAARRSGMLKQPIRELAKHSEDGGPVANALVDLKLKVEELDPHRFDFSPGWASRFLGAIPGIGTPLKRYFTKYESAQTVIDAIIRSLEMGRDQLKRDNITLGEDQRAMRELTEKLTRQIGLGQLLDQKLEHRAERELAGDETKRAFVREELIFPLRQRIMDLQQQLAVNQQGILSIEIIIRNNKELIRGVNRALDVTVGALQVAVTVALALANQKIVLDKISALNQTTSDLIAGTARQLRTQGTAIHTQASSAGLDMESLKSAFADINAAMTEIATFRREALPQMAQSILEFDELVEKGEQAISEMEQAKEARPILDIE